MDYSGIWAVLSTALSTDAATFTAMQKNSVALLKAFDEMEAERTAMFAKFNHSDAKYSRPAADGGWSVAQVCIHLSVAEAQGLAYMRKKLSGGAVDKATFNTWYRATLLRLALWLPIKYKAPSILKEPDVTIPFGDAEAKWTEGRAQLRQFLVDFPVEMLNAEVFKHPAAGKITIMQTLKFMHEHQNHHMRQVRRILGAI